MTTPTEQSIRKACEEAGVPYLSFLSYRPGDYLKNAIVELARRIEAEAVPVAGLYGVPKLSSGSVKAGDAGQLFNAATPQPDRVAELEARIEEVNHYHKKRLGTYKAALEMLNEATARAEAAEAKVAVMREALETLRREAFMLYQNAMGCAANHYGEDFSQHGVPGWLADSEARITAAAAALQETANGPD